MQFFSKWPILFKEGRICKIETPIVIGRRKGKPAEYFYTLKDYEASRGKLKGYEFDYIKGLGSLTDADYKYVVDNPVLTVIELDSIGKLDMAFGKDANLRKEWMLNV